MHLCDDTPEYMGSWLRDLGRSVGSVASGVTHIAANAARSTGIIPHDPGSPDSGGGQPIYIQGGAGGMSMSSMLPYVAIGGLALILLMKKK